MGKKKFSLVSGDLTYQKGGKYIYARGSSESSCTRPCYSDDCRPHCSTVGADAKRKKKNLLQVIHFQKQTDLQADNYMEHGICGHRKILRSVDGFRSFRVGGGASCPRKNRQKQKEKFSPPLLSFSDTSSAGDGFQFSKIIRSDECLSCNEWSRSSGCIFESLEKTSKSLMSFT